MESFKNNPQILEALEIKMWTVIQKIIKNCLKFEILVAVEMLTVVFWVAMPCRLVGGYSFRGTYSVTYKVKKVAVRPSKTSVTIYKAKQCQSPAKNSPC